MIQVVPGKVGTHHHPLGTNINDHLGELFIGGPVCAVRPLDYFTAVELGIGERLRNFQRLLPGGTAKMGNHHTKMGKRLEHICECPRLSKTLVVIIGTGVRNDRDCQLLTGFVYRP